MTLGGEKVSVWELSDDFGTAHGPFLLSAKPWFGDSILKSPVTPKTCPVMKDDLSEHRYRMLSATSAAAPTSSERCLIGKLLHGIRTVHGVHVGVDHARRNAVDPDIARAKLLRERLAQADNRSLARRIMALAGRAALSPTWTTP